jgi:hypothetical protein
MAAKQNDSLWNWLGRQVGHVKKAVKADVTKPKQLPADEGATPQAAAASSDAAQVIYRDQKVEEVEHPENPNVVLRRTVIDEAIVRSDEERDGRTTSS